ncbi:MAG: Bax inhibitor-1 family protein [Planctomycetota bacterium]
MQPQMRTSYRPVAESSQASRAEFLLKTYAHVFAALSAFALIEIALFKSGAAEAILRALGGTSWLLVMGAFVLVGWLCSFTAHRVQSLPLQYVALGAYVLMEALVFVPLLYFADAQAPGTISSAAYITLAGFAALTAVAYFTRIDFSFLRAVLIWAGICALIAVVAGVLFGFELGTWFSVAMVALAGASMLYNTSNVLLRYPEERHVAAALELFGSVALMFFYVLRLLNSRR